LQKHRKHVMLAPRGLQSTAIVVPLGNIDRGWKPLQDWQVDSIGPLLRSPGNNYILTTVDTATGLLFTSATMHASRDTTIPGLEQLTSVYGTPRQYIMIEALILLATWCKHGLRKRAVNGNCMCHISCRLLE
jgi:hypothetical protein